MLTTALCFFYISLRQQVPPPKPPVVQPPPNADPLLRAPGQVAADAKPPTEAGDGAGDEAAKESSEVVETQPRPQNEASTITLGDPNAGYKLQVTLTSRGAGVEQAELVERSKNGKYRYRALEHDGGYLGYLGLREATTGLVIRTIPKGAPAASAVVDGGGLQIGDVIVELNGQSTDSLKKLEDILSRTKAGQSADLSIERVVDGKPTRLKGTVKLSEAPLDVLRMYPGTAEVVAGNLFRPSLLTTLGSLGGTQIPVGDYALPALQETLEIDWEMKPLKVDGGEGVEFRLPLDSFLAETGRPAKLELVKRYRLYPSSDTNDGYLLDLETVVENHNESEVSLSLRQEGPAGLTLEGWWYSVKISPKMFAGAGQRDVIYANRAGGHLMASTRTVVDKAKKTAEEMAARRVGASRLTPIGMPTILLSESEPEDVRSLDYIGVDAPYFVSAILPHPDDRDALTGLRGAGAFSIAIPEKINKAQLQATNTSFWLDTNEKILPAGGELSQRFQVFIGPKAGELLEHHGLGRAIEYGWFPLIAKPLSAILHFFHYLVGNYGLAIMMLTVVVRSFLFPFTRKAMLSSQKMQERMKVLQPELKIINEKYKDDFEKRSKATQELYAKHNFNPAESLAGCLPMFIQMPIFIGLYRCLSVDISLRQAALIPGVDWASNLAGPDQLVNWSTWMPEFLAGRGTGWLGPYFNILPLVTVGLFLLQQKMLMPKATDEQTRMTQNMMQIMTVFMGVLFFKVPSGLCIYFITSSVWSLVERTLVKRTMPPPGTGQTLPTPGGSSGGPPGPPTRTNPKNRRKGQEPPNKPAGRFHEIVQMLDKPSVKSTTQRGSRKDKGKKRR